MNKHAVIFGGGNIGRGFIGQLLSESGYPVTFIDIDRDLVDALNHQGAYRLQTVFNDDVREYRIGPVRAIHASQTDAVEAAVAQAELGATAVGAGALKFIALPIAGGVRRRAAAGAGPLNLIICENLKGAAAFTRQLVREKTDPAARAYLDRNVGFVDTVIGRMVPLPTPEMRAQDVGLIRAEPYKELPVDRSGFVGPIPSVVAMTPETNFALFTARKLYIHNCGHALHTYPGYLRGHEFGWQALEDREIRQLVDNGLRESMAGIVATYGADPKWLQAHADDLMTRFANRALGDTVFRLGRDPLRKLAPADRLVAPANLAMESGHTPRHLAWAIAAALLFDPAEDPSAQELQKKIRLSGVAATVREVTGVDPEGPLGQSILEAYEILRRDRRASVGA